MTDDPQNPGGWPDAAHPSVPMNPEQNGVHCMAWTNGKQFHVMWVASWKGYNGFGPEAWKNWTYLGPALLPAEVAARVEAARRKGYADAEADHQRRLEARFFAALPVFVSDPGRQHWPMTSVKAARECAERAAHAARREALEEAASAVRELEPHLSALKARDYPNDMLILLDDAERAIRALLEGRR